MSKKLFENIGGNQFELTKEAGTHSPKSNMSDEALQRMIDTAVTTKQVDLIVYALREVIYRMLQK